MAVLLTAGCPATPPDAPRPAVAAPARPSKVIQGTHLVPVSLVSVRAMRPDEKLARFAGPEFLRRSRDPIAIEVKTEKPLPVEIRDSSPAIVLNGQTLPDTWAFRPDTLVAFLPDRERLRENNVIEVVWLGAERATRSPRALSLRRADVP